MGSKWASQVVQSVKIPPARQEMQEKRVRSLVREDPLGGGHGNPLQYSCLENSMDRGAGRAKVHGVTKSQTLPKQPSMHAQMPYWEKKGWKR